MKAQSHNSFVQQFPHLKSEWKPIVKANEQDYYENIYSEDLCQIENVNKISMKELDAYSVRQAYSFPFCPKIYKYRIQKNYFDDKEIRFDAKLLIQKIPFRLNKQITLEEVKMLNKNLLAILKGYEYLCKRFGKFYLTDNMIGWTNLNIVKIWFNEDFASNQIALPAESQEQMISQFIKIMSSYKIKKMYLSKTFKTLQSLIKQIENGEKKYTIDILQPINFNDKQQLSQISSEYKYKPFKPIQTRIVKTRKNTTFSFSSKDILTKKNLSSKSGHVFKRNSIKINEFQQKQLKLNDFSETFPKKQEISINNDSQISSLKLIYMKKQKKKSFFCPDKSKSKSKDQNSFAFSYREDQNSKHSKLNSNKNSNCQLLSNYRSSFETNSINQKFKFQKPQFLHYSTSTNPFKNLINSKTQKNSERSHSFVLKLDKQNDLNIISQNKKILQKNKQKEEPKVSFFSTFNQECQRILIDENQQNHMKSSQEIKNDLDALFNSTNEFDASLLERELDQVFQSCNRL